MSRQQILTRLAERHNVVYSRGPFFSWDRFKLDWNAAPLLSRFQKNHGVSVHIRSKVPMRVPKVSAIDRFALRRAASTLRRETGFSDQEQSIAYVFHPSLYPLAKALKADRLVYHPYDKFSSYPGIAENVVELEKRISEDADVVIAMSETAAQTLRSYADRLIHVIPNGADYHYFSGADAPGDAIPSDVSAIPGPRVAYFGNISAKVDIALLHRIAKARRDWSIVIVGGDRLFRNDDKAVFSELVAAPNVYWLGHKAYEEVAPYVRAMDVNVLAYRVGESLWSEACSPLKLYEYLAAGPPIVSSSLQVTDAHEDIIAIARNDSEWLSALEDAIDNRGRGTVEERRAVARRNTWDARLGQIEPLILGQTL
jgi:glycosyltransferase involved in cell wall biosynthesis